MSTARILCLLLTALAVSNVVGDDLIDRLDEALTLATDNGSVRARLSGTVDLEAYHFIGPPPGVIDTERSDLFVPRGTIFFDAQIGPSVYAFMQVRIDRGFDPGDGVLQARFEEFALRYTPWNDGRVTMQIGRFGTVVGNWMERHLSWDNPFINAPLPYEGITGASDLEVPASAAVFHAPLVSERYDHLPVIWGPSYATGISLAGSIGGFGFAVEMKNAALSSRPESWDVTDVGFDHPTFSGRFGYRPNVAWNIGVSASVGPYLRPEAERDLPHGRDLGDYDQLLIGQDVSYAWRHIQIWAEWYWSRFEIPRVGSADTFVYFLEAKYKLTPQLFAALRWNQQFFSEEDIGTGGKRRWGENVARMDVALGYRFTAHSQVKLQYTIGNGVAGSDEFSQMAAAQFTVRF